MVNTFPANWVLNGLKVTFSIMKNLIRRKRKKKKIKKRKKKRRKKRRLQKLPLNTIESVMTPNRKNITLKKPMSTMN